MNEYIFILITLIIIFSIISFHCGLRQCKKNNYKNGYKNGYIKCIINMKKYTKELLKKQDFEIIEELEKFSKD